MEDDIKKTAGKTAKQRPTNPFKESVEDISPEDEPNILRKEIVNIKFLPKENGINDTKHVNFGGMNSGAKVVYVCPKQRNGEFLNVLTKREKEFLELAMGLEYNALSIYNTKNNFWENYQLTLYKGDNFLDLSIPDLYIKYALACKLEDDIAKSVHTMYELPKPTYKFVIVTQGEETSNAKDKLSATRKSYMEFGKIENDTDSLRIIIETIEGRPVSKSTSLDALQIKIDTLIKADSKLFLKVITDPFLPTKVLIKQAIEAGIISNRDNHFYLREDNMPLCEGNEEATLAMAAKFLNSPKHQDILFAILAKLKQ